MRYDPQTHGPFEPDPRDPVDRVMFGLHTPQKEIRMYEPPDAARVTACGELIRKTIGATQSKSMSQGELATIVARERFGVSEFEAAALQINLILNQVMNREGRVYTIGTPLFVEVTKA